MNGFADTFGVLGGAQPQFDDRFGAPQQDPRVEDLIRAMAMRKVLGDMPQGNGGQWGAPMAPVAMPTGTPRPPMTDFGGAAKMQPNVPMPRPDPRDAQAAAPDYIAGNTIPDLAPMGAPQQSMQDTLPTGGQRGMNRALSGIGAGFAQIQGNTAGANFARGFGASIAGGNKRGDSDFDQQIKILDRLKQAAESGDSRAYKQAQTEYLQLSNESIRREMANPNAAAKTSPVRTGVVERMVDQLRKENPDLTYAQALELAKRGDQSIARENLAIRATRLNENERYRDPDGVLEKNREKYGARPGTQKPAEQPMMSAKPIAGSQNNPHRPTTRQEAEAIKSGEWFIYPKTGNPMVMP